MNTTLIEKEFKEAMIENHDLKKSEKFWKAMFNTIEDQLFTSYEIVRDFMNAKGVTDEFKSYVKTMIVSDKLDARYRDFFEAMLDDFSSGQTDVNQNGEYQEETLSLLKKKKAHLLTELSLASNEGQINIIGNELILTAKEIMKIKNENELS
ncbi:hypothetical protein MOF25_03410 [Bacillus atrophaeus]|uniref:hypothetical protein n=1 Tax=Bacillus atrophaeus TaxID=1452 RepID=UPI00227FB682|nr:hypothetical protein [Bacillus atrophaeus]MCY9159385.1 hypothetical protein [Bacillus atrophaeus]